MKNGLYLLLVLIPSATFTQLVSAESPAVTAKEPQENTTALSTKLLTWDGDLASRMVDGVDAFLLEKISQSQDQRTAFWRDVDDINHPQAQSALKHLRHILGLRDPRPKLVEMRPQQTLRQTAEISENSKFRTLRVAWPAVESKLGQIHGEGLILMPTETPRCYVVAIPDCDQTPEEVVGGYAGRLAASGCCVVVPSLISRRVQQRRQSKLTNREYLYRSSFELGRQLAGYELQKVLATIDWMAQQRVANESTTDAKIGVIGWGEGGRLSLFAAAVDDRIDVACVSGYFAPREKVWQEPLDRNVFGLLNQFGDAELVQLSAMQSTEVVVDLVAGPIASVQTQGGAPYELTNTNRQSVKAEVDRIADKQRNLVHAVTPTSNKNSRGVSGEALENFALHMEFQLQAAETAELQEKSRAQTVDWTAIESGQIAEIERYNQALLTESPYTRAAYFRKHDRSNLETHATTIEPFRDAFRTEVIGEFQDKRLPLNARSRQVFDEEKWTGHEVVLDVFPNVFAFGILLLPKDIGPDEKRPVVVCQHGLEGRPRNVIEKDHPAYHDYAAKLAERGFITFAPQNIYIFTDRFRTLQRKANSLGKTLFSIMVPQHQQIVDWLATLPQVDPERIAFYGLSYGGKSAMRIPPLVDRYCLSICSADFNDWVWKNASTRTPYSYVWSGEYEIFEWDLGSTFNYAEMAALIAPKPFMVERGHFDGVAPDDRVAKEFAKVRNLYQAKLGIGDRCEIEFFVGPHTINGKGTFEFLQRHLNWPRTK